jgi:hypothetical protein
MKTYGEVDAKTHIILTSALAQGEWSVSRPGCFTPSTHWLDGWVGPRIDLDDVERRNILLLQELKLQPLGCSAHSQSLYRLSYAGSFHSG